MRYGAVVLAVAGALVCAYAQSWIVVKHHYELSVTKAEKGALRGMLERCTP